MSQLVVTDVVFLDLAVDALPWGRVVLGLYGHAAPRSVTAFLSRCTRSVPVDVHGGRRMDSHSHFFAGRVFNVTSEFLEGGFAANNSTVSSFRNSSGSESSGEDTSEDEGGRETNSILHDSAGLLSVPIGSIIKDEDAFQFTLSLAPLPRLHGINVVIGRVLEGIEVLDSIPSSDEMEVGDFSSFRAPVIVSIVQVTKIDVHGLTRNLVY